MENYHFNHGEKGGARLLRKNETFLSLWEWFPHYEHLNTHWSKQILDILWNEIIHRDIKACNINLIKMRIQMFSYMDEAIFKQRFNKNINPFMICVYQCWMVFLDKLIVLMLSQYIFKWVRGSNLIDWVMYVSYCKPFNIIFDF